MGARDPWQPDIARLAALIADPARARMLVALLGGQALTAGELARIADITPQTCSSHLARLRESGLLKMVAQGRHRYYTLANARVAALLEHLHDLAGDRMPIDLQLGPKDAQLRHARVCFDHLAGESGVRLLDALVRKRWLRRIGDAIEITVGGESGFSGLGIDVDALRAQRRPLCRSCLDWSMRRPHLAGGLGAALLDHVFAAGWAKRQRGSRIVVFNAEGQRQFDALCRSTRA